jgi:hypothetical protein
VITEYEIPISACCIWTVKVEEQQPGEFIAWCSETTLEGVGVTAHDAVEDFVSAVWPPSPIPEKIFGPPVPTVAKVYRFPLRGRVLERAITGELR